MYERHRARTYYCDLCGRNVTLLPERRGYGAPGYYLPNGWTGSHRKRGCCLCPECSEAVRAERERRERLDEALGHSDDVVASWCRTETATRDAEGDSEAPSCDGTTECPDAGYAGARGAEEVQEGGQA